MASPALETFHEFIDSGPWSPAGKENLKRIGTQLRRGIYLELPDILERIVQRKLDLSERNLVLEEQQGRLKGWYGELRPNERSLHVGLNDWLEGRVDG